MSLRRPGMQASRPSRTPVEHLCDTHHLGPSGHPGCPVPSPTYSQPIAQHSTVAVATELQCCFVLGRSRIAVGWTLVCYVMTKDVSARTLPPQVSINPRGCVWRHRLRSP